MYEKLDEPIAVLALFEDGHLRPLRFRWNGRAYSITKITGHWIVHEGQSKRHHYAVLCEQSSVFEMRYDPKNASWQLLSVYLDG